MPASMEQPILLEKNTGISASKPCSKLNGGVLADTPAVAWNLHAGADVRQLLEMGARSHDTAFDRAR